jgi:hypothetical protein
MEDNAQKVKDAKAEARKHGRELDVYTVGVVTCRRTRKEAEEYYRYAMIEKATGRRSTASSGREISRPRPWARPSSSSVRRQGYVIGRWAASSYDRRDPMRRRVCTHRRLEPGPGVRGYRDFSFRQLSVEGAAVFFSATEVAAASVVSGSERLGIRARSRR